MAITRIGVIIHRPLRTKLFTDGELTRLGRLGDVRITESEAPLSVAEAAELIADSEIGIGSWQTPYPNSELLSRCTRLRLWEHAAGSVKHMFGPHLSGRNLTIASCKTAIADDVAEMALGEIIVGLRMVLVNAAANRVGIAPKPAGIRVLSSATIGVIGASEVGKRIIRRLKLAGAHVIVYDPYLAASAAVELGAELEADLALLCTKCDAVTLHTPNIPACRHILGKAEFEAMRDDAVFVNTSRGECIDEQALVGELERGRLFAFLDVSSPEPATADSPLRLLPNVVYTSHIAGPPSFTIGRQVVDDVAAYLSGGTPLCVVTADQLDSTA